MRNSNPAAIEAYQKTRRHAHARGGLKRLEFQGSVLDSPEGPHANSAAFTGAEDSLAVVCDGSLHLVDTRGHRFGDPVPVDGACRCVSRSRQGRLAIGSDEGRIWIWDADGTPVETAMTPYSTLRRARIRLAGEGIAITTVSWSDKGNVLACCGTNEVWIYHVATRQMTRWPFPEHLGFDMYYGAHFVPGRNEFLVFGRSRYLWVVELPTLEIRTALELKRRPGRLGLSREYGSAAEPPAGPVFTDIYAASPSPLGDLVACAGSHGQVAVYDLESMVQVKTFAWHEPFKNGMSNQVLAVSFSPDGQWLASVARDGQLVVGNTRGWEAERTANVVDFTSGDSIDWSPDSTTIAETASGLVGLWRM